MRGLLLLSLALTGCTEPSPMARTAPDYATDLEPLLYENGLLAQQVLFEAAAVYNGAASPEEVYTTWTDTVVPLARHLADQAIVASPPEPWAARHETLVSAWSDRADAYQGLHLAIEQGDPDAWKAARKKADDAKLREEEWFRSVNQELAPLGIALDQYP